MDKLHSLMPEYVILEKLKDEIEVRIATKEEIAPFVQKHYLHKFPTGTKAMYGIFRKETNEMIGMIIYGQPFPTVTKALAKLGQPNQILELKRLFIDDVGLRNAESFVIGQSLKLLQHDQPDLRVVITFADAKAGHVGGIYQATNATYIGQSADGKYRYLYFLGKDADKMKAMVDAKPYPKKEMPTQLDKAIAEAEAHIPGAVRMNQAYFGMVKTNHLTGKCEWVMESTAWDRHMSKKRYELNQKLLAQIKDELMRRGELDSPEKEDPYAVNPAHPPYIPKHKPERPPLVPKSGEADWKRMSTADLKKAKEIAQKRKDAIAAGTLDPNDTSLWRTNYTGKPGNPDEDDWDRWEKANPPKPVKLKNLPTHSEPTPHQNPFKRAPKMSPDDEETKKFGLEPPRRTKYYRPPK